MYGLPGQTPDAAVEDVSIALGLGVRHVSAYHLTVEPNTWFHRYPPALPDEDEAVAIEQAVHARLAEAGLERYEVSAFAQAGQRARHNINYWTFGDYLGIGAGAHGKLSMHDRIFRQVRHRQPQRYMETALAGDAVFEQHDVAASELGFEFMLNAWRLLDGVPVALFSERTGLPLSRIVASLDRAEARGLITRDHQHMKPTALGMQFHNDLVQMFLQD
jgi:oxygen-independent coproporphyrinogen-3 oxidase